MLPLHLAGIQPEKGQMGFPPLALALGSDWEGAGTEQLSLANTSPKQHKSLEAARVTP